LHKLVDGLACGLQSCFFQDKFVTDIVGSSEAETLVSGKAEYSISMREDKKSELFGVPVTLFN